MDDISRQIADLEAALAAARKERAECMKALLDQGFPTTHIAAVFGVSRTAVAACLDRYFPGWTGQVKMGRPPKKGG